MNKNIESYKLSAESNFTTWPNVEVGIETSISDYSSAGLDQRYITNKPYANIEAIIPGGFAIVAEYTYTHYQTDGNTANSFYAFLNGAVYYRKADSAWEFKLAGTNLLNTEFTRQDSFNDNIISTYKYYVQPMVLMFTVKYDL